MANLTYTTPLPSLMRELREVESDAGALAVELARAQQQYLPSDFPVEQLQELLVELQSLPLGTAEGCRRPLEYARGRLPAIRRQFIKTEEESRQSPANADAPPALTRGMTIDVRIGALVNSVTTALDEYRALASVQDEDAADTAPSHEVDVTSPDVAHAMSVAERTERNLGEQVSELERITRPDSITADSFKRQMRDTRRLLSLARIELRMPAFVPLWYQKTIDTVHDYPRILRATARAIQMGVDVARPMVDAWHSFEHGFSRLVLESVERATNGLLAVAQKWEVERAGGRGESSATTAPPLDFEFAEARAMVLRGEAPPPQWRPWITALQFSHESLHDLAPLARLTALQHLVLDGTQVTDLAPLARLTALQHLDLGGTQVTDLASLARLTALQHLIIGATQVTDLAPLAGLTALQDLDLTGTQVTDLAPLARLTALKHVHAYRTQVSDLAPLDHIRNLRILGVDRPARRQLGQRRQRNS